MSNRFQHFEDGLYNIDDCHLIQKGQYSDMRGTHYLIRLRWPVAGDANNPAFTKPIEFDDPNGSDEAKRNGYFESLNQKGFVRVADDTWLNLDACSIIKRSRYRNMPTDPWIYTIRYEWPGKDFNGNDIFYAREYAQDQEARDTDYFKHAGVSRGRR